MNDYIFEFSIKKLHLPHSQIKLGTNWYIYNNNIEIEYIPVTGDNRTIIKSFEYLGVTGCACVSVW